MLVVTEACVEKNTQVLNERLSEVELLGCVQTDATTPKIVASVLAVLCKRMKQLQTMLEPAVHRGKDTTHKSL